MRLLLLFAATAAANESGPLARRANIAWSGATAAAAVKVTCDWRRRRRDARTAAEAAVESAPAEPAKRGWALPKSWAAREGGAVAAAHSKECAKAAGLMKRGRSVSEAEQAVKLLRAAHASAPDDVEVTLKLVQALNCVMRIKTDANSLVIDGSLDTPANKQVWSSLGAEALPLAKVVRSARPNDAQAAAVYADAFMFFSSSKGIVKQALGGTAKEYKRMSNELISKHTAWDGAVGYVFLAGLYNVAPWPVGNKQEAKKLLTEAVRLAPTRRNLYYTGVNAYVLGEFERAAGLFERALKAGCGSDTEEDIGPFLLSESKRALGAANEAAAKAGGGE